VLADSSGSEGPDSSLSTRSPVAWSYQWHSSIPAATTTEFQPCVITHVSENGVATAAGAVRAIAANTKAPAARTPQTREDCIVRSPVYGSGSRWLCRPKSSGGELRGSGRRTGIPRNFESPSAYRSFAVIDIALHPFSRTPRRRVDEISTVAFDPSDEFNPARAQQNSVQ
jgi:hypothetical protein